MSVGKRKRADERYGVEVAEPGARAGALPLGPCRTSPTGPQYSVQEVVPDGDGTGQVRWAGCRNEQCQFVRQAAGTPAGYRIGSGLDPRAKAFLGRPGQEAADYRKGAGDGGDLGQFLGGR